MFLAVLLAFIPFLSGVSLAQQQLVQEIQIHGNRRIPAETIRARIFTRPGDVYDDSALQRDFNSLWNTGYFEDLRIEREDTPKGFRIHIYVREKPTIREITYVDLKSVSQSDVLERFKQRKVGLTIENQYDPTKVKKAEVTLKELLAEHGRQFAEIRSEVRTIPPAAVAVKFIVKEGPKVKVGKIRFEGNKNLSSRALRSSMRNLRPIGIPKSIFLENLFSKTYDANKLSEDLEMVRDAYQQKGYFKALVGDPKTAIRDTNKGLRIPLIQKPGKAVDITIPIEEGEQFRLGSISFRNNKAIPRNDLLRRLFPMKDGEIFNVDLVRKGLKSLREAYGELGYINFTAVPETKIDDEKKLINLEVDVDEGKPFLVRRIEFQGNTTTRDKVIRRELAVEEGGVYNTRLWELSLLRLNQLNYFEQLKPEQDSEVRRNEQEGTVDITLKVKEKGKNSIGLTGGVSGLSGSFIGINYQTNNFLGLGETLTVEANVGSRERNLLFGFTEPYAFDRPLQLGFTVFSRKFDFNQARQTAILTGGDLNVPESFLQTLQNFSQTTTGFTASASYALRRSFKRVGLTYSFDTSSVNVFSEASRNYFEVLAFRGISGPNALEGVVTSKVVPSFSFSTIDNPYRPHAGRSFFVASEFSGLGGNVRHVRPVVEWKQWIPMRGLKPAGESDTSQRFGFRVQGSFLTGYGGRVAPPFGRSYLGGDTDLRGFDIRTVTPWAFITRRADLPLLNPDGSAVPRDPNNLRRGNIAVPIPISQIVVSGGDTSIVANAEYRYDLLGPVTVAAFVDFGLNMALRNSQLRISDVSFEELQTTDFGCVALDPDLNCIGAGLSIPFSQELTIAPGTNYVPRMSTGLEVQVLLPVVNAPFRLYWAYNPLILDTRVSTPVNLTRDMYPAGAAGDFSYQNAINAFGTSYRLREPKSTLRFTVSTTF